MFFIVLGHSACFTNYFSDKRFVLQGEFIVSGIGKVKTEAVGPGEVTCRSRVVKLCYVLYAEPLGQQDGPKGSCQVYQMELAVAVVKYVRKVKVSVAIISPMKLFRKFS